MDKTFVIRSPEIAEVAIAVIQANYSGMLAAGRPMAIRLYEHKDSRSIEQQSLMWIRLGEIAPQAWINGRQFADVCWHEYAKREFLPEEPGPSKQARKGYAKWAINPMTGDKVLVGSTTQLTVYGMAEYLTKLEAFGAGLGVRFSATPTEIAWRGK
jgi:hypothetical protein